MRRTRQKEREPQDKSSATRTTSNTAAPEANREEDPLLHLQQTIGNQAVLRLLRNRTTPQIHTTPIAVHGLIPPVEDPTHESSLEQFSQETGVPREQVSQHDPVFQKWLCSKSPINITLDLPVPADPAPDYSRDQSQLGAWERADFRFTAGQWKVCVPVVKNNIESSFVTDIGIRLAQPTFEYFISSHIYDNMNDQVQTTAVRIAWKRVNGRIQAHAQEHFNRYRQVVASMQQTIMKRFAALPTCNNPIQIPQQELEAYVDKLLDYLVALLQFELWKTTCDWEKKDYPNLLKGTGVSGNLVPACYPQPTVPPNPTMPVVVKPGASGTKKP